MRINPDLTSSINAGIQQTQAALDTAVNQLSSGSRVSSPTDDPFAYAQDLRSLAASANVDRYTKNADAVLSQAQMADSALSTVVTSLTQAISLGTQGANGIMSAGDRAAIATQVQGILSTVVAQANLSSGGVGIFSGTAGVASAFTADASSPIGYTYRGNSGVNQAQVGGGLQIAINTPGDQIFTSSGGNVLGSLAQLATALQSGNTNNIGSAITAISAAIAHIGQQRVSYASTVTQLHAQESFLSQDTITLSSQQQALTGIDLSTAATNLTQAQTAHSAVLAAAAKVLPVSLLDYLK
jgi:flagellar hook-associated protein 3 FlgL